MRYKRRLAEGRSSRWAFMDKFQVPEYDGPGFYLTRYRLIRTPWFGIYLHRFDGPDPRATLHDHPWTFRAFVLRGGYIERRLDPVNLTVDENHVIKWYNKIRASDAHSIRKLLRVPTWTLMVTGKDVRQWGYLEPVKQDVAASLNIIGREWAEDDVSRTRWVWTPFYAHLHAIEYDEAMARHKALQNA